MSLSREKKKNDPTVANLQFSIGQFLKKLPDRAFASFPLQFFKKLAGRLVVGTYDLQFSIGQFLKKLPDRAFASFPLQFFKKLAGRLNSRSASFLRNCPIEPSFLRN